MVDIAGVDIAGMENTVLEITGVDNDSNNYFN